MIAWYLYVNTLCVKLTYVLIYVYNVHYVNVNDNVI